MVSCSGCIREDYSDCGNASLNLIFTHEGSIDEFDRLVANDIELHLYDSQGKAVEKKHIPYKDIQGGKPYPIEQQNAGNTYLLAWTLSDGEAGDKRQPAIMDEDDYFTAQFAMNENSRQLSLTYSGSARELFLESMAVNRNLKEEKILYIDVKRQLCTILVTIEEGDSFRTRYPGKLSMSINGSSYSYQIAKDKQCGRRITVKDDFFYLEDADEYVSKNRVIPASVDSDTGLEDNIVVTLFEDEAALVMIDTEVKAERGTQIDVVIRPTKLEAIITVGSWQIRKALVMI